MLLVLYIGPNFIFGYPFFVFGYCLTVWRRGNCIFGHAITRTIPRHTPYNAHVWPPGQGFPGLCPRLYTRRRGPKGNLVHTQATFDLQKRPTRRWTVAVVSHHDGKQLLGNAWRRGLRLFYHCGGELCSCKPYTGARCHCGKPQRRSQSCVLRNEVQGSVGRVRPC